MLTYFEKYYIGKPKKSQPGVRAIPCYPIGMWNCYQRVLDGEERTNNSIEAWHRQFEVTFVKTLFIIYQFCISYLCYLYYKADIE